ncbi:MAG TPA: RHS repeat-associated core domain-containing protein, partial [Tepidisphaeraceae bacterium]|nr:RHS repeat-associated core domain-containing protein [Tepidisphaeraceae bacterium]
GKPGPRLSSNGYDIHDSAGISSIAGGVVVQPDGKIVVASTDGAGGTGKAVLLRYTTGGALDTTFDSDGVVETNIATGDSDTWVGIGHTWDGKIVVSGYANGDFAAGRYFSGVGLNQRLYVQQDANFNVTSVSNSLGATVERYRYTPYGQRTVLNDDFTVNANPTTSDYGFDAGHQGLKHDAETGLIYNRARYLHNTLGRFTSHDPLDYVDGLNLVAYVNANPSNSRDPLGLYDPDDPTIGRGPHGEFFGDPRYRGIYTEYDDNADRLEAWLKYMNPPAPKPNAPLPYQSVVEARRQLREERPIISGLMDLIDAKDRMSGNQKAPTSEPKHGKPWPNNPNDQYPNKPQSVDFWVRFMEAMREKEKARLEAEKKKALEEAIKSPTTAPSTQPSEGTTTPSSTQPGGSSSGGQMIEE